MKNLQKLVFLPASIAIVLTIAISLGNAENFSALVGKLNGAITNNIAWLFNGTAVIMVLLCLYALFSKVGNVRIGGEDAEPLLSRFKWFAVSLTTVIAMGIVFWPVAEAVTHYTAPSTISGVTANTPEAALNSMAVLFVHWTITPYAIYSVLAMTFALSFYNLRMPFSISTIIRPLMGKYADGTGGRLVDSLGTFSVVLGMSATMVSCIMAIAQGVTAVGGPVGNYAIYALIAVGILLLAMLTSISGLQKGIQHLARINTWLYFFALAFFLVAGPTSYLINLGTESLGLFIDEFFQRNLVTGAAHSDPWAGYWTVAYFGSWFAWAPITCLFLGRIAKGYTIREFLMMNLLLPAFFGWLWFSVFGGTGIFMEAANPGSMKAVLDDPNRGFGQLIYVLFDGYPGAYLNKLIYIFICLISFATAANANLDALGALCTTGITPEKTVSPIWLKVFWGACIGTMAYMGMTYMGLDAIRALFNMSGLPGLIIALGACAAFVKVIMLVKTEANGKSILEPVKDGQN
ncbi:MAG: BCCT family transporter [Candidatus Adiutrix sp.]|jgi:choline-glycine betaine transporter|nr:BCCT family transporter [Candidatus Adiutrix sp.]